MLRINDAEIYPATIDGHCNNAFMTSAFAFSKPRWISDQEAVFCAICRCKFNQIRRRHHCRCCGKVLCNKCCTEKVPLPQYGLNNPERVCSACVPVASCVTMSYSNDPNFQLRAASGLSTLCRDCPSSVVALGGAHVLVALVRRSSNNQLQTLACIANSFHSLSQQESLTYWLSDIGALAAIAQILSASSDASNSSNLNVVTDGLSSLRLLVKSSDKLKAQAFDIGCFPILLKLCHHVNPSVSLIATSTLCLLAQCSSNHGTFIAQQDALRTLLMKITKSFDEQVKEHVLRIIVILSTGNDDVKHIIASEDAASGGVLAHALQSQPHNQQIIASAAAAIANLATNDTDQVLLQSSMRAVLNEIQSRTYPEYVTIELIRAAANFSQHSGHASTMLTHLSNFIQLLSSKGSKINFHAVRLVVNLLQHRSKETISLLCKNGVEEFLLRFTELDCVMSQVVKSLSLAAPPITS